MLFCKNTLNFGILHCLFEKKETQKIQNVQNGAGSLENGKIMALVMMQSTLSWYSVLISFLVTTNNKYAGSNPIRKNDRKKPAESYSLKMKFFQWQKLPHRGT